MQETYWMVKLTSCCYTLGCIDSLILFIYFTWHPANWKARRGSREALLHWIPRLAWACSFRTMMDEAERTRRSRTHAWITNNRNDKKMWKSKKERRHSKTWKDVDEMYGMEVGAALLVQAALCCLYKVIHYKSGWWTSGSIRDPNGDSN